MTPEISERSFEVVSERGLLAHGPDAYPNKTAHDPRDQLRTRGRCLAHFAGDPALVYVTTHLEAMKTRFLPFNRGRFGGAGNPPVPPTQKGYATDYLWEEAGRGTAYWI